MEIESTDGGVIGKLLVAAGTDDVPVGCPIAILLETGEDAGDIAAVIPNTVAQAENARSAPEPASIAAAPPTAPATASAVENLVPRTTQAGGRLKASPLARRIAGHKRIRLSSVTGSGPGGRIVVRDLDRAKPVTARTIKPPVDVPHTEIKLSKMRKVVARRLSESKQTVPHFYLTIDVNLDKLLLQRARLTALEPDRPADISINNFVIRAAALALEKVPAANAQFADDYVYLFERADISVAVATDRGLVTPVIRGANSKNVAQIAVEMKDLATRAREGKLRPEDYQGGTFSISNLGMYGIRDFSAVINPPQGAILAVGVAEHRAVVRDGGIAIATVMTCTLSCDHRVIDGAVGAQFLGAFRALIEGPIKALW
jgi:pyruvate dehydrogenase E2 component (dihydrolipoamide acetyltransferase)